MAETKDAKNQESREEKSCGNECEVYSRIVGYFRPVQNWNIGKKEEFNHRTEYTEQKGLEPSEEPSGVQEPLTA